MLAIPSVPVSVRLANPFPTRNGPSLFWSDPTNQSRSGTWRFLLWGGGEGGLVKGGRNQTRDWSCKSITRFFWGGVGGWWLDWALSGLAACTYPGSCDRTHSVFLLLFWWDMDLEKQKDWATDMYEVLRVKSEPFFRESFSCLPPSLPLYTLVVLV